MSNWLFPERDVDPEAVRQEEVSVARLDADALDPGTNVLIAGPPMMGKRRLAFDLVAASRSKTACLVTTKGSARRMHSWFETAVEDVNDWALSIVDCTSGGINGTDNVSKARSVHSPGDLTGISIALSGILQQWYHDDVDDPRLAVHSVSTMLMYADIKRVFQFCHILRGRLQRVGAVSAFVLDTSTHRGETYRRLAHVFDAVVEVRENEDGPEFRVHDGDFGPSSWTRF